jgi:hypothetical protein
MRLSAAIRLGAKTGPQVFGMLEDAHDGTCALGAARRVVGSDAYYKIFADLFSLYDFPIPSECSGDSSCLCQEFRDVATKTRSFINFVAHLNDHHEWTRERIADYVKAVEDWREGMESAANYPAEAVDAFRRAEGWSIPWDVATQPKDLSKWFRQEAEEAAKMYATI